MSTQNFAHAEDLTWSLLLHSVDQQAQITDPKFLLSHAEFSPEHEQALTIAAYKKNPAETFCRYPARLTYLAQQGLVTLAPERFELCPDLKQFVDFVPMDTLELVYASEVLSSATSMMGHVFLKASGRNFRGTPVAHSLAYFTEITSLNPVKLVVESTMTGMPGFFTVRPFEQDVEQYLQKEQRNLWQFKLKASKTQLLLLKLHIWELRQIEITYLFQSFNCATMTLELLALLDPTVLEYRGMMVSPADVVKAVKQSQLIEQTHVHAAPHWLYSALNDSLGAEEQDQVQAWTASILATGELPTDHFEPSVLATKTLELSIAQATQQGTLSATQKEQLLAHLPKSDAQQLDLSQYKHPAATPQDSVWSFGFNHFADRNQLLISFLPAGHQLLSDNRQYLSESELMIAKTTLAIDSFDHRLKLHEFDLYNVQSLSPDSTIFPVMSGEFYVGYRQMLDAQLQQEGMAELSGAAGKSWQLHADMTTFAMAGGGLSTDISASRLFAYAKTGLIVNLVGDMKWLSIYQANTGKTAGNSEFQQWQNTLSWFVNKQHGLSLQSYRQWNPQLSTTTLGISYHYYF